MADTLGVQSARKKKSAINYMVLPCANVLFAKLFFIFISQNQ